MNSQTSSLQELKHRKYYQDHPTSGNHKEKYIIPLQNQYSILNKTRNPYQALDNFSFDIECKGKQSRTIRELKEDSLNLEVQQWQRRQQQKQNSLTSLRQQVSNLSRLVQLKDTEYQMERIREYNKPTVIPMPVYLPFGGLPINGLNSFSMMGSLPCMGACSCVCSCQSNHVCKCKCRCNCAQSVMPQKKVVHKFRPILTENKPVEPVLEQPPIKQIPKDATPVKQSKKEVIPQVKSPARVVSKPKKMKKTSAMRRWRKCIIAIYFCFYFKWFSFQFSLNRYNHFKAKYLVDNCKNITETFKEVYLKMLDLDILRFLKEAASKVADRKGVQTIDISSLLKKQAVAKYKKLSNFGLLSSNPQVLFARCAEFLQILMQYLTEMLVEWKWGEVGYGLGVGCLNQSFVIDNIFLPHQISLMLFHDGKGYARITGEQERTLLMIKLIVKLLIYNVCLQLDNNKEWFQKWSEKLNKNQNPNEYFIMLEVATKILFIVCQNLYEASLETHVTNYDEVENKFQIEPCNPLVYAYTIKTRRQLYKKQDLRESNLLIYGIENLDEVNEIMKQAFFQPHLQKINSAMQNCLQKVLEKLKVFNRKRYSQTQEETLDNQYIILRGLKKYMKSNRYYLYPSKNSVQTKKTIQLSDNSQSGLPFYASKISIDNKLTG